MAELGRREKLSCSFCGKTHTQVLKLIAGPGVYICDECVALCVEIIAEEVAADAGDDVGAAAHRVHDGLEDLRRLLLERRVAR